ncbi:hypothetical protein CYFUS_006382 [Cystobacter fuscus]|uniref:DUF7151 domain-containing protein n=1 Tax=Cystobacter fuscus TaxID=43 RepID=A0A250JBG9_9BACT|nr:hypothetical protein [Cystobacter fuscus]ATB40920.1 hypothetical protein CYFUS_006382 [Cystobacter fuscus]
MYQQYGWRRSIVAGLVFAFTACSSPTDVVGANGKNASVRLVPEPPGARCPQGGTAIQTGLDDNGDGSLGDDEVEQTSFVCSGSGSPSGGMSLVKLLPEAAGARCASGGTAVLSGLDTNADGIQGDTEVTSTQYICDDGEGKSGGAYLVKLLPEASGTNCSRSGTAVLGGIDVNANAQLESTEVTTKQYVCNTLTETTGTNALIRLDVEPAGANCSLGGTAVKSGLDANGNGTLETSEVTNTTFVCNGLRGNDGQNGKNSLVRLDPEPAGANCVYGGTAVKSGLDSNGDRTLNDSEVTATQFVCSAANLFRTKWASNPRGSYISGEIPSLWVPVSRRVTIYKTKDTSRIKITVSDNFRVGVNINGGSGWYSVRMNGSGMGCDARQYNSNSSGWGNNYHLPFANVCLTEQLPTGLYEFDVWGYSDVGTGFIGHGTSGSALLLAEEMDDAQPYAFSKAGSPGGTTSSSLVKASGREVTFTKQSASTLLKVTLADTLRAGYAQDGGSATVMVRLDGVNTSCYTGKYDSQGAGGNFLNPFVMTCILPNVSAAQHKLDIAFSLNAGGGDAYLGWERSSPLLLVEELPNTGLTYSNMNIGSGELSGNWAGVGARQITHAVSAAGKTLKVTYSDTFRAVANCNGRWGFVQLYVDYQPTGCVNGQYVWNAGANQQHHHPMNLTCLVPNLTPGYHTFSIWSTTQHSDGSSCGSNYFGWNRGQNLLLVEELP